MRRDQGALDLGGDAAIRGPGEPPGPRAVRWSVILIWFMRLVAALWIAKGLSYWAVLVGAGFGPSFEARAMGYQATVIYFAIVDLVAAVGLWLTSTWGGVLWLLAVMSHLVLAVFFPGIVPGNYLMTGLYLVLILLYFTVSWLAASEEQ